MPRTRKIQIPGGPEVEGVELTFRAASEEWSEYLLDDQSVIRFRAVVTEVIRLEGVYDPEGQPVYLVNSQNIVKVSAPENLRRPPPDTGMQQ